MTTKWVPLPQKGSTTVVRHHRDRVMEAPGTPWILHGPVCRNSVGADPRRHSTYRAGSNNRSRANASWAAANVCWPAVFGGEGAVLQNA